MTEEIEREKKDEYFRVIAAEKHLLTVLLHDVKKRGRKMSHYGSQWQRINLKCDCDSNTESMTQIQT